MGKPDKVDKAFERCSVALNDVDSAFVSTFNEMSDEDIERHGRDSLQHEVACFQAVEAAFFYGMMSCAVAVKYFEEPGRKDDAYEEIALDNKVMSSVLTIYSMLKAGYASKTFDRYLSKARDGIGAVDELSSMFDVEMLEELLSQVKEERVESEAGDGEVDGERDILSQLQKAKKGGESRMDEE